MKVKFDTLPSAWLLYASFLWKLRTRKQIFVQEKENKEEQLEAVLNVPCHQVLKESHILAYRQLCMYEGDRRMLRPDIIPMTYLRALAFPLQVAIVTSISPFAFWNYMPVSCSIEYTRALTFQDTSDLMLSVRYNRESKQKYSFTTRGSSGSNVVWQMKCNYMNCESDVTFGPQYPIAQGAYPAFTSPAVDPKKFSDGKISGEVKQFVFDFLAPVGASRRFGVKNFGDLHPIYYSHYSSAVWARKHSKNKSSEMKQLDKSSEKTLETSAYAPATRAIMNNMWCLESIIGNIVVKGIADLTEEGFAVEICSAFHCSVEASGRIIVLVSMPEPSVGGRPSSIPSMKGPSSNSQSFVRSTIWTQRNEDEASTSGNITKDSDTRAAQSESTAKVYKFAAYCKQKSKLVMTGEITKRIKIA